MARLEPASGSARFFSLRVDAETFRLTRARVILASSLFLAIAAGVVAARFAQAEDLVLSSGAMIGGDYIAFYVAAKVAAAGEASSLFDAATFQQLLIDVGPAQRTIGLLWQYPPTYLLLIAPLALVGYLPGYAAFTGGAAAVFFLMLRACRFPLIFLFVALAAPVTFQAAITGQNGFLTATLIACAALLPDRRPVLAGLAAALLTVKPHLGVLLPFAYLAGGCGRAFAVAAFGSVALAALSLLAYGAETWIAFFDGLRQSSGHLAGGVLPLFKMVTPFATLRHAGAPMEFAFALSCAAAAATLASVMLVWRRVRDRELRAAALCAGVFLVAPYGYYYELIVLALPAAIIARRGLATGWLPFEPQALVAAFALPLMLPGEPGGLAASVGLLVVLTIAASVARRIAHESPTAFRFASAASSRRAD
jgi:hypothetical protein